MRYPPSFCLKITLFTLSFLGLFAFNPTTRINVHSDAEYNPSKTFVEASIAYDEFNIMAHAFERESHRVKHRETFSDILSRHHISNATIARLVDIARPIIDFRRIRAGNTYTVYKDTTEKGELSFFVYQEDPIQFVVFDFRDTLRVTPGRLPVKKVRRQVEATINNSLYETLAEYNTNPMVAIELSEIFAWQVDFYRIMKGDRFNVIYEEEYVGDKSLGVGNFVAAMFHHDGEQYTAFPFEIDGRIDYYDDDGNSLRRPFLKAPLRFDRISSRYALRRFHPVQKRYKAHLGTDYAAPTGTPVHSTADGVVVEAGYTRGNGRYVKVKHNSTYSTGYLHFSRIATGIKRGVQVKQGDIIGYVGSSGLATGPHLCYRFWKNGRQVDPLREKLPDTVEPLPSKYLESFNKYVNRILPELYGIDLDSDKGPLLNRPFLDKLIAAYQGDSI